MKRVAFALAAVGLSFLIGFAVLLGADLYAHHRFDRVGALNRAGYRGDIVGRKQPGERRIVVVGGSTAFGYGVAPELSMPANLERILNSKTSELHSGPVSVVNLAYNNEGAYAFRWNLAAYRSLDYDVAVLYTGYNDLGAPNTFVYRQESAIFRLTGYMPTLPLILREKAMALRSGGQLERAYRGDRVVFTPTLAQRATAEIADRAASVASALDRQLGSLTKHETSIDDTAEGCGEPWTHYCSFIQNAIAEALVHARQVVVVGEPYISDRHVAQQAALAAMLHERYANVPNVRYVNLGYALDVRDTHLAYDGMHLTFEGNKRIAGLIAPSLLEVLK